MWQILSLVDTKLPDPGLPVVQSGSVVCKHRAGEQAQLTQVYPKLIGTVLSTG